MRIARSITAHYAVDYLEAARAAQARSQASLNAVREENLRKQRIAIQIMRDVLDETFQAIRLNV